MSATAVPHPLWPLDPRTRRIVEQQLAELIAGQAQIRERLDHVAEDVKQIVADRKADEPAMAWVRAWRQFVIWGGGLIIMAVVTDAVTGAIGFFRAMGIRK